jgi:tetratricopeptide (TPR) repeat protein
LFAQQTPQVQTPRESQRAEIAQTVGDVKVSLVYHRPNTKGRAIWGKLVPYGKVWRSGANEATTIEFSGDVSINGQKLPAGKYSFHTVPNKTSWTLIFNKVAEQWGSFNYDEKQDALRVTATPMKSKEMRDSLMYEFANVTANSSNVILSWEKVKVGFTVDIGDIHGRVLTKLRDQIARAKGDAPGPWAQAVNYVATFKIAGSYEEALGWANKAVSIREAYGTLVAKANLLAAMNRTKEAIETGEKALEVAKTANPPVNPNALNNFKETLADWKTKK